ncbi:MAG TPA: 1-deoxy-D-xylulose-5-phosphate reductoisomerase [bacterium]|nr:1-deoxy-D-xylulose-5-phosphate reductoisomerase [bacterium]
MKPLLALTVVGSTGSIGESTLRVVDRYPDRLSVVGLSTGRNLARLSEQVARYRPEIAAISQSTGDLPPGVRAGDQAIREAAAWPTADVAVIAAVGFAGVRPTLAAITAGKRIALANKETLVAAGAVVMPEARRHHAAIVPIDSEHSAIWQCLQTGARSEVRRLILTASGGPFRTRPLATFGRITPAEALAHPTWSMGPRITIDSATMMNKGFEIIEAAWLFDLPPERVDVVIHPQSIVHSMVEFQDGSVVAQMGIPDMTLPITYALFGPERPPATADVPRYQPAQRQPLEFFEPAPERYPALELARAAWRQGPTGGAVLNAADEVAVAAFLEERLPFTRIIPLVERVLSEHVVVPNPTIGDIEEADRWARRRAEELAGTAGGRVMTH